MSGLRVAVLEGVTPVYSLDIYQASQLVMPMAVVLALPLLFHN